MPGTEIATVAVRVGVLGADDFAKVFRGLSGDVANFANAAGGKKLTSLGGVFAAIGGGILYAGNAALVGAKDFDVAMRNIQTVSLGARLSLQQFEDGVRRVALATNTSAVEAAKGMYQIVSSGFDGADAMKVLQASLTAATAGLTDTDTAARSVLAVLNAYGQSAGDAKDVSDILFQTVNLGIGTFEELAAAVGDVVGVASQVGVPFADVAAAMAAATRSGQTFADASTGVNRIIQDLLTPTAQMTEILRSMGYVSGQAALQGLGFQGVMEGIRSRVGQNAGAYVTLFSRIDSVKTGLALAADEGRAYADVAGQITSKQARADAATKAFGIQMRALNNQSKELHNSVMTLAQSGLTPILTLFEQSGSMVARIVDQVNKLNPAVKAGAAVALVMFGAFSLLIGGALLTLPAIAVFAAVAIGRLALANWVQTQAAIRAAVANSLLMRSFLNIAKFQLNANLAMNIGKLGARVAGTAGLITMSIIAFDQFYRKGEQLGDTIQKLNTSMSDDKVEKAAIAYGKLSEQIGRVDKAAASGHGEREAGAHLTRLIDAVLQTHFSIITLNEETTKAFDELAKSSPKAAQRLIDHAVAAGVDADGIYKLKKALYDAQIATLETMQATGEGASAFQTAGGQVIMVADSVKTQLDDLRTAGQALADSFGGMFGDAGQQLTTLTDQATSAKDTVASAQATLDKLHKQGPAEAATAARDHAKAIRDAAAAQHDLDVLTSRKPKRQRGERQEDYDIRVAEEVATAKEKIADANARMDDQSIKLAEHTTAETDATKKLTDAKKKEAEANQDLVMTGDQLMKRLKDQEKAQMEFYKNTTALQNRLGAAGGKMIGEIIKKGPKEGGMEAAALAKMSDKDLAEYLKTYKSIGAITTATAMEDWSKKLPADIQTNLAELWAQVGGDVGKFIELGAGAGEASLTEFLKNTRKDVNTQLGLDAAGVGTGGGIFPKEWNTDLHLNPDPIPLPAEWTIQLKLLPDTTPIPGVNQPLGTTYQGITQGAPQPAAPPPEKPTPPPPPPEKDDRGFWDKHLPSWLRGKPHQDTRDPITGKMRAAGGVFEDHQAMIGRGDTRIWNEPETGGEAYIPLSAAKRGRSEGILDQVAGIFGGKFQKYADGGVHYFADADIFHGETGGSRGGRKSSDLNDQALQFLMEHGQNLAYGVAAAEKTIAEKVGIKSVLKTPAEILGDRIKTVLMKGVIENWRAKGYVLSKNAETGAMALGKVGGGKASAEVMAEFGKDIAGAATYAGQAANIGLAMYQFGTISAAASPDKFKIGNETYSLPPHMGVDAWLKGGGLNVINSKNQLISLASLGVSPLAVAKQVKSHGWWGASKHKPSGLLAKGNIDLHHRPVVHNPDGSISTVRSISFEDEDNNTILVPTVSPWGTILSNDQAVDWYYRSGQQLGIFGSRKAADKYAQSLHEDQASEYLNMPTAGVGANRSFNPTGVAQKAMLQGGVLGGGGGGGSTSHDSSTHIQHTYSVGQVVTPDPAAFEQWAASRQRLNALAGL